MGFKLSSVKLVDSIVILDVTHTFFPDYTKYVRLCESLNNKIPFSVLIVSERMMWFHEIVLTGEQ